MDSRLRSFFIIINPQANDAKATKVWEKVRPILDSRQIDYAFRLTDHPGHATQHVRLFFNKLTTTEAKKYITLVIGGDGTLNEVLNALKKGVSSEIPLAFLPAGKNNNFAKGIGLAEDPLIALEQILATTDPVYYDIGEYQETTHSEQGYFLNDFGIGLDAYMLSLNKSQTKYPRLRKILTKLHLHFLVYLLNVVTAFLNQEAFALTLRIGEKYHFFKHARLVNIANHPYFEKGVVLSPKADVSDHKLDLIIADNLGFFRSVLLGLAIYFKKQLKLPYLHHYKDQQIHLIINSLEFGQIDGEDMGSKYYDIFFSSTQYPFWIKLN